MTLTELKQVILGYIRELYNREYVGGLDIQYLDPTGYKVSFYLDRGEYPLSIITDLSEEEFLPFIKEELRSIKLHKTKYFSATKLPPEPYTICK